MRHARLTLNLLHPEAIAGLRLLKDPEIDRALGIYDGVVKRIRSGSFPSCYSTDYFNAATGMLRTAEKGTGGLGAYKFLLLTLRDYELPCKH